MTIETDGLANAIASIPNNWFIDRLGEMVTPICVAGDKHERMAFSCSLQHRRGGLLTVGESDTLAGAVGRAIGQLPLARAAEVYGKDA